MHRCKALIKERCSPRAIAVIATLSIVVVLSVVVILTVATIQLQQQGSPGDEVGTTGDGKSSSSSQDFFTCDKRTFTIVNNCGYTLWVGQNGNTGGDGWQMDSGDVKKICLPHDWSGRFWPMTGCRFDANGKCPNTGAACCDTGACVDSERHFAVKCAVTGVPPATLAEFTLVPFGQPPNVDWYDVSMVDGMNVPMEITPNYETVGPKVGGYDCGSPGCTPATCPVQHTLSTCTWNINAGKYYHQLNYVSPVSCQQDFDCPGSSTCNLQSHTCDCTQDECAAGKTCGISLVGGVGLIQACGVEVGYLAAHKICSLNPSLGPPLSCAAPSGQGGTYDDLYGCIGVNSQSCYQGDATTNCCGCPSWSPPGECRQQNSQWHALAEPTVAAFKDSCPTAYSYPYDDPTSTFVCGGKSADVQVSYTVTLCPAGSPGSR